MKWSANVTAAALWRGRSQSVVLFRPFISDRLLLARLSSSGHSQSGKKKLDLSGRQIARFAEDILAATEAAHQKGIMHCDLKPHNLVVSRTIG